MKVIPPLPHSHYFSCKLDISRDQRFPLQGIPWIRLTKMKCYIYSKVCRSMKAIVFNQENGMLRKCHWSASPLAMEARFVSSKVCRNLAAWLHYQCFKDGARVRNTSLLIQYTCKFKIWIKTLFWATATSLFNIQFNYILYITYVQSSRAAVMCLKLVTFCDFDFGIFFRKGTWCSVNIDVKIEHLWLIAQCWSTTCQRWVWPAELPETGVVTLNNFQCVLKTVVWSYGSTDHTNLDSRAVGNLAMKKNRNMRAALGVAT